MRVAADFPPGPFTGRTWLITGATGFIGSHLVKPLLRRGDRVIALARSPERARRKLNPKVRIVQSLDELPDDASIDGIVNLAGEPIFGMPWTAARRQRLRASRIETTRAIVALCARLKNTPTVLVNGSAIGYYGVHGDEAIDETSPPQPVFQSELCSEWESAASAATAAGVRVTCLRTGVVLSADGGALPRLAEAYLDLSKKSVEAFESAKMRGRFLEDLQEENERLKKELDAREAEIAELQAEPEKKKWFG